MHPSYKPVWLGTLACIPIPYIRFAYHVVHLHALTICVYPLFRMDKKCYSMNPMFEKPIWFEICTYSSNISLLVQVIKRWRVQLGINSTSDVWKFCQNWTSLLLAWQNWILLNVNIIFSHQSPVLPKSTKFGAFVRIFN
jgi:hypothetical protein